MESGVCTSFSRGCYKMIRKKIIPSGLVRANAFNHVDAVFLLLRLRNQIWMIAQVVW